MLIIFDRFIEIRELLQIDEQSAAGEVDREFAAEKQRDIRPLACECRFHDAADNEIDRNRDIRVLLGKFILNKLLDDKGYSGFLRLLAILGGEIV
jgi:hypothetical protein